MILRNDLKRKWAIGPFLWAIPLLLLAFIFPWSDQEETTGNDKSSSSKAKLIFDCDVEKVEDGSFVANGFNFDGVGYRSRKEAHSESHSVALSSSEPFGLTTLYVPSDYSASYHLTVWRLNPKQTDSWLVVASTDPDQFYLSNKGDLQAGSEDWEQLHLVFQIPEEVDSLKIYCYAGGSGDRVYFDDLRLEITDLSVVADTFEIPQIELQVSDDSYRKLKNKRDEAWDLGLLKSADDDWVPAKLTTDKGTMKSKIRLKGDWLDHLRGTKWSFRVKVKDPNALWGLKTFNLQRPETRGFLREWFYHQWLDQHDVLTPHYEFVLLSFNNNVLGFYALEEHFEKELVESRRRREGPILKFNEERFWAGMSRQFEAAGKGKFPLSNNKEDGYWASEIQPFKASALIENPNLQAQFERAYQLLAQFKYNHVPPEELFDVEAMGKYLAIIEMTGAYHSLTWHNQRWYYNPLSDRLEPIGFDGFTELPPTLQAGSTLLADEVFRQEKEPFEPFRQFFRSPPILASYTRHLLKFTDSTYQETFLDSLRDQAVSYERLLREEYFNYKIDWRAYHDRIARIRLSVIPYASHSIFAQRLAGQKKLSVTNAHHLPLEISGYTNAAGNHIILDDHTLVLPNARSAIGQELAMPDDAVQILFQLPGLDSIFSAPISSVSVATFASDAPKVALDHPLCQVQDGELVLRSGQTTDPMIIPAGYQVIIPAGTTIDLTNRAHIISFSPLTALGSESESIEITSSDGSGALLIKEARQRSSIRHARFSGLDRINSNGYVLTGGVTFYNTSVDFMHCSFVDNHQEDALNLVRCDFSLQDCFFSNTAFDAFDADFCTGSVRGSTFKQTGNDALDFSGSIVQIYNCTLLQIGDKGISVGEHSEVSATDLAIDGAVIGVASKDLSTLNITNLSLRNVGTGLTAFQKKPTFGPAEIIAKHVTHEKVRHLHIVEVGSSLELNGVPIVAN